jgi:hypothetical protein
VDLFLRTLNSLQDSLASSQNEDAPMEEPDAAADAATGVKKEEATGADRGSKVDGTVGDEEGDKNWADQTTYIEEEPWPGDLQPMWPNFSPGV